MTKNISLSDARAILAKLIEVQKEDPIGALQSMTIEGRTYSFKTADELIKMINYWSGIVSQLQHAAAGAPTFGRSVAVFNR